MGACCGGLGWGSMGWGGMGLIGPIVGLVAVLGVFGLLAIGAVWAARQLGRGGKVVSSQGPSGDALEIARRRLAAGEITSEEFEEIRDRLLG